MQPPEDATPPGGVRFGALAEALNAIVAETSAHGPSSFNARWFEYTGLSVEESERHGWIAAVHPEDTARVPNPPDLATSRTQAEFRLRRADGQYRWHGARATPTGSDAWLVAAVDIHDHKLAGEALRASDERAQALFTSLPALLTVAGANGQLQSYNDRWLEYTGLSAQEAFATNLLAAVQPDDHKRALELWERVRGKGQGMEAEIRIRRADGMYRWHVARAEPSLREDESVYAWVTAYVDIHEVKLAEGVLSFLACSGAVLSSSLDLNVTLTSLAHLAVPFLADCSTIDIVHRDGQLARVAWAHQDPSIEAELKASSSKADEFGPSHPVRRVLRTCRAELITENVPRALAVSAEHLRVLKRVNTRTALYVPLIGDEARAIGVIGLGLSYERIEGFSISALECAEELARRAALAVSTAQHLEQERQAADELRKANAVKDELLGLVSHELRTPLTTIAGVADVLRRRMATMDEATRISAVDDIVEGAERLQRLIENMLVLSHVESTAEHFGEPVLVRRLIARIILQHQRRFPGREVSLDIRNEVPPAFGDPTYIEQIVQNLLGNAEKYSPPGAPINFVMERVGDEVHVAVLDHGVGITAEEREHIFEPFFRSNRIARSVSGAGLGLPVCKRLLEVQGGRIWATAREGGGTIVSFALPLAEIEPTDDSS